MIKFSGIDAPVIYKKVEGNSEDEIKNVMILDKNENEERILVIYPNQKMFYSGMLGGFLGCFRDGKNNEILYVGKVGHFGKLNYHNDAVEEKVILEDNKKVLSAIKQLNGNENNYMSILKSSKNPEKELEKITFEQAEKLVEDKKAELKQYKGDMEFILCYKNDIYWRNDLEKAYCR